MATGSHTARGIYQYGEDDSESTFSALLNMGMISVHTAMKYFSGPPAQRFALIPAPDGATWQDTDPAARRWTGVAGSWVQIPGPRTKATLSTATGMNSGWTGVASHPISVESDGITASLSGRLANSGFFGGWGRPWATLLLPDTMRPGREIVMGAESGIPQQRACRISAAGVIELYGEAASASQWILDSVSWRIGA